MHCGCCVCGLFSFSTPPFTVRHLSCGPKSVHLGSGRPPIANAGQYATSHCNTLLFWFPCKRWYINVWTFDLYCPEDTRKDYQNCSVLYCVPRKSSSYRCTMAYWFKFSLAYSVCFACFPYLGANWFLFCVFGVFSVVYFELSVPVQVIACKDSSLK